MSRQTKVVPSAMTYLCFCVVTSGFPAVLIGVVVILTYIFAASPCEEPAMWLPCIPNIPRSEYFYDTVSQDCLPKDKLPIGCLSWDEVPGAKACGDNCYTPRLLGKPLSPSCYQRFVLQNCSADTSLLADTFIYNKSSGACIKRNGSQGCYKSPHYFKDKITCESTCSRAFVTFCPPVAESESCQNANKVVRTFYNTLSGHCEDLDNLCLAGLNRFQTLTICLETCLQRTT